MCKIRRFLIISFLFTLTTFSYIVTAEENVSSSMITLESPLFQPHTNENFILNANWNLSKNDDVIKPQLNPLYNYTNVSFVLDTMSGWVLEFNGENSSLNMPTNGYIDNFNQPIALTMVFKFHLPDDTGYGKDWSTLFSVGNHWESAPIALLMSWADSNRPLTLIIDGTRVATVKTNFVESNWYTINVILSKNFVSIKIDGASVFEVQKNYPIVLNETSVIHVGSLDKSIYPLDGDIKSFSLSGLSTDDNSYNTIENILVDLNLSYYSCILLRSTDNITYNEIGSVEASRSLFTWNESLPNLYYYKAELVDSKGVVIAESTPISINVVSIDSTNVLYDLLSLISGMVLISCVAIAILINYRRVR